MTIRGRVPAKAVDALVVLSYVLGAVYVLGHLWLDPNGRYLTLNYQDHYQFEWFLTHATQIFTDGEDPFFSTQINYPGGVNLMANTSVLALAVPLAPITLLFGAGVTFTIISTLALCGTAAAWYWALNRHFGRSRAAAFVGGGFLGFAPSMMSQISGHPNIAGQYLIPLIIVATLRMREPGHVWRHGLVLAGLVVLQCGINEEMLFFTALALGVFLLSYVPWRELPGHGRVMAPKLGVTLLVAGVVLAYPLYRQFFGQQTYSGLDGAVRAINMDVLSYVSFNRYSIAGDVAHAARLNSGNATEENSFFGWPLVGLLLVAAVVLWRNRLARALGITAVVFAVLSLGNNLRVDGVLRTHWYGPWKLLSGLPLFDTVVPTRLALIVTTVVGVALALVFDKLVVDKLRPAPEPVPLPEPEPALVGSGASAELPEPSAGPAPAPAPAPRRRLVPALAWGAAVLVALAPLTPLPQPAQGRKAVPAIFTDGNWRTMLPEKPVVMILPGGWDTNIMLMGWSKSTDMEVAMVGGYFLGPNDGNPDDKTAHFGPADRETTRFAHQVRIAKTTVEPTDTQRANLRADVRYWKATTLVYPEHDMNVDIFRATFDKLVAPEVAPARLVGGVWVWDVRPISGS